MADRIDRVHGDGVRADGCLDVLIIGAGFAGIGMAYRLIDRGTTNFIILEKAQTAGGVWRDNVYPGAACDVPSHLYSFSFAPNPDWSRMFAPQAEIHAYLERCTDELGIRAHIRFGAEVVAAAFDEARDRWAVTLADGRTLHARIVVSAVGQLSRPAIPRLPGADTLTIPAFHSAHWDHGCTLAGKRVGVIGTGASTIQFVPAIADQAAQLTVFQRSAAYVIPKADRAYSADEKRRFAASPGRMRRHRLAIYLRYEARALAFTRFKALMGVFAGRPFRAQLRRQVSDPALRAQLVPDYPIGCKRLLLSNDYLATMARPDVTLETQGIDRLTPDGVVTRDGRHHAFDVLIYGTGFAATEFLSPMRITGRDGLDLNRAWRTGASAYLGISVPSFPNFFLLYGPNTNLGHNSIVYMLESQIGHILRCLDRMDAMGASRIEVAEDAFTRYDARVQARLTQTVWTGCQSWYVNEQGRNTTNWPGFTLTYRRLTRRASLDAYRFSRPAGGVGRLELPPQRLGERATAGLLRGFLRTAFRPWIGPPFPVALQRGIVRLLSLGMPRTTGVRQARADAGTLRIDTVVPDSAPAPSSPGAILYLHGGAFCLGSAQTHCAVTSRLARAAGLPVWVPDYRLAPEHPYPAGLQDALACWQAIRRAGYRADQIVIAGDSAGGSLALALALLLRDAEEETAAGLALLSPLVDLGLRRPHAQAGDPMLRRGWLQQAARWYRAPADARAHLPLKTSLAGLPPMLVQVGDQELLLSDAQRLAEKARRDGVPCRLEIHAGRWHVFQLQAAFLGSARRALADVGAFARDRVAAREARMAPVADTAVQLTAEA